MEFEWDSEKAKRNHLKHDVRFQDAISVLYDECAITVTDDVSDPSEKRFVTIGMSGTGRVLVVVYTYRGEAIRIISARKAEPHEQQSYGNES